MPTAISRCDSKLRRVLSSHWAIGGSGRKPGYDMLRLRTVPAQFAELDDAAARNQMRHAWSLQ
ncbi:hypothetical protein [Streptomyces olivaceoviridis]|uniref:hypothetical protein n=1 Tax=Streptomyces olivaceoviridis TaxID=1921 RepID=UPI003791969B